MRKLLALLLSTALVFATVSVVVLTISSGVAVAEKQNKDQDKANKKKQAAGDFQLMPAKHSASELAQFCAMIGGIYNVKAIKSKATGKVIKQGQSSYSCQAGCGEGGCNVMYSCDGDETCFKITHRTTPICPKGKRGCIDYVEEGRVGADNPGILDSGPALSVNQPARTGTPKLPPAPPAPPPAPPPPPPLPN